MAAGSGPHALHLILGEDEFLTERATMGIVASVRAAAPAGRPAPRRTCSGA